MSAEEEQGVTVSARTRAEIEEEAAAILKRHGLLSIPIDPVTLANASGIKVHNAKFSDDRLSGMVAKRGDLRTILVNQSDAPFRKRFTIAHELGHHFLHLMEDGEFYDSEVDLFRETGSPKSKQVEVQANQFAAALLMPKDLVREALKHTSGVANLARVFNVSEEAMGIRLAQLGIV